ncbi:MAG: SUMF1/EgtB/PvdO family nonheme iron enzyme [Prolixibacteraceae bacterium]|jgi:sulfatase modifying factor 1|nr:SUMF1/EgtB/PvdO family nonheme iron enzyme [Prolixibacteraceae bacterium]
MTLLLSGCKKETAIHDLRGKARPQWFEPIPYGMSYIKEGSFKLGMNDESVISQLQPIKNVSVNSFWIDDTEITNDEYREYINWIRDSVAASLTFKAGIEYYMKKGEDNQIIAPPVVDRLKISQIWTDDRIDVQEAIQPLYYQGDERIYDKKEIDYRHILYTYSYIDLQKAAKKANSYNYETQSYNGNISSRLDFLVKKSIPVYPDTLVWVRDFTYSFNEPWTQKYFYHPAFKNYPVVGVTWEQANAFCHWRTEYKKIFLAAHSILPIHDYRLPTEVEWEYAARGGRMGAKYPWGSYYTANQEGCYMANFKPKRGNYIADNKYSSKTIRVAYYPPNDYGLYDMAGNVSEWTSTAYDELGYEMIHDLNPEFQYNAAPGDPSALKRKVIRGGSWKDVAHYLEVSSRDYEYQDTATSFIGFRCVMNAIEDEKKSYDY